MTPSLLLSFFLLSFFAFLTWRNLETGILLICALLPSYLIRFSIGGIPTTFLEVMVLIVIGVWGIKKSQKVEESKSEGERSLFDSLTFPLCLLLLAATIGIVTSPDKFAAIGVWKAFYIEPILMFFVLVDIRGGHKAHPYEQIVEKIFHVLGISALLVSLFGLIQYFFSIGIPSPWDLEHRITSVFDYPNALALFLEPIIVISWFMIAKYWKTKSKEFWFWTGVSILSTINIFLAKSEAGIAALILTALGILLFSKVTRKQTIISIMIISAFVFAIPTSRNYLVEKLTFRDSSELVRLSQWKETIELLKDHSIFGAGLSGYPILMKQYHHDLQYEIFQYPHNIILNIWVELGLLGLIAFFWLAIRIIQIINTGDGHDHPLQNILFCAIFFEIIVHGLVDVPYFKNDLAMMMWILIACMISLDTSRISRTQRL